MKYSLACLLFLVGPVGVFAGPAISFLDPPVVQQGATTRVRVVGQQLQDALTAWHSLPDGELRFRVVESTPTTAVLDITATDDAPVGIAGLRLATKHGLSNVQLFLVDDLPLKTTQEVPLSAVVSGAFREGEVERYTIRVTAGQRVTFETVGSRFGKDCDPLLTIRNAQGKQVAQRDNDPGLFFDARFEHTFGEAGTYTVEVRDSRFHGSPEHRYALRLGRFPAARVVVPNVLQAGRNELIFPEYPQRRTVLAVRPPLPVGSETLALKGQDDDGSTWYPFSSTADAVTVVRERDRTQTEAHALAASPATTFAFNLSPWRANPFAAVDRLLLVGRMQATRGKIPGVFSGVLREPAERQAMVFELEKGQTIYVRGEAKGLHSVAELDLQLTDRFGREQRRGQDRGEDVTLDFTANIAGQYGLVVRDALRDGGVDHTYRVTVRTQPFPPTVTADVEGLTIPQGSAQTMPLLITRTGSTGPIALKLVNAPPGLTISPNEIGEKETAIVAFLQADPKTPLGVYAVQLLATSSVGESLVRTQPLIDKQIINVDLIPHALRDDQKRLPPSVADRFAVQITPAAPFTFEVDAKTITLPRYQQANIPIKLTRQPGYTGAIRFTAKGGQLADKNEGRTRVYAEFPVATGTTSAVNGSIHSKILSNLGKVRIDVTALAEQDGRQLHLTRTFELHLTTAFQLVSEPAKLVLAPGESGQIQLQANREPTFTGAITVKLPIVPGLTLPEEVVIPAGQSSVPITIRVAADANPSRPNITAHAYGQVSGFEEDIRFALVDLEIRKPEVPKKK